MHVYANRCRMLLQYLMMLSIQLLTREYLPWVVCRPLEMLMLNTYYPIFEILVVPLKNSLVVPVSLTLYQTPFSLLRSSCNNCVSFTFISGQSNVISVLDLPWWIVWFLLVNVNRYTRRSIIKCWDALKIV